MKCLLRRQKACCLPSVTTRWGIDCWRNSSFARILSIRAPPFVCFSSFVDRRIRCVPFFFVFFGFFFFTGAPLCLLESIDLCKVVCLAASRISTSWERAASVWLLLPSCRLGRLVKLALELQGSLTLGVGAVHSILGDLAASWVSRATCMARAKVTLSPLILNTAFSTASLLMAQMKQVKSHLATSWRIRVANS